jgi:hypothetical protein
MKKLFTALFSLLTATGGHLVQRRWDQALLFFALLLLWVFGGWTLMSWFGMRDSFDDPTTMMLSLQRRALTILGGVGAILVLSAVTTWVEARSAQRATIAGIVGGTLVTLLSLALIGSQVASALLTHNAMQVGGTGEGAGVFISGEEFHEHIYYGRPDRVTSWSGGGDIDSGDGVFVVAVNYRDTPAAGVELNVTFDNGKTSGWASTDSSGQAVFHMPPGDYVVKSLRTRRWSEKPEGRKVYLDNGLAPGIDKGFYWPHEGYMDQEGLEVHVTSTTPEQAQLTAGIRDEIQLEWPQGRDEARADLARSAIRWQPVPGAAQYRVQLSEVHKDSDRSASYHPVVWHDVKQATLPLSALPTVASPSGETHYTTEVYAFDAQGKLIAKSERLFEGGRFVIQGERRFPDMQSLRLESYTNVDDKKMERIERDRQRLDAAETLIDDDLYEPARELIQRVASPELARRKGCVMGQLLAKQGDCDAARQAFAELTLDNPDDVIPQRYLATCKNKATGGKRPPDENGR